MFINVELDSVEHHYVYNYAKVMKMIKAPLTSKILSKLPYGYYVSDSDIRFYNYCDKYWDGKLKGAETAVSKALENKTCPNHVDPYELLIDSKIMKT